MKKNNWLPKIVGVAILIFIWYLVSILIGKDYILPSPNDVIRVIPAVIENPHFISIMKDTLLRTLSCVAISIGLGIGMGTLATLFPMVEHVLSPLLISIKTVPTIVIILYVILWLNPQTAPIFVATLVTFPIVYSNIIEGFKSVSKPILEMAQIYNLKKWTKVKVIYYPTVKPYLKSAMASVVSLALKVVISAEILSQTKQSIGLEFQMAKINIQTDVVFAWAIITIALAMILDAGVKKLLR